MTKIDASPEASSALADVQAGADAVDSESGQCATITVVVNDVGWLAHVGLWAQIAPELGNTKRQWFLKQHPEIPGLDWTYFQFAPLPTYPHVGFETQIPGDYEACLSIQSSTGSKCADVCVAFKYQLPSKRTFLIVHQPKFLPQSYDCWAMARFQGVGVASSCQSDMGSCCPVASVWSETSSIWNSQWWPGEIVTLPSGATVLASKGGDLPAADLLWPQGPLGPDDGIRVAIERIFEFSRGPQACGPYVVVALEYDKGILKWTSGPLQVSGNDIVELGVLPVGVTVTSATLLPCAADPALCANYGTCAESAGP